jgi:hypothetical protein
MKNMWLLTLLRCDCDSLLTVITTTENTVFAAPDEYVWSQHSYSVIFYCRLHVFAKNYWMTLLDCNEVSVCLQKTGERSALQTK